MDRSRCGGGILTAYCHPPRKSARKGAGFLTRALVWFASPSHPRDHSTIKKITKPLRVALLSLMVLLPMSLLPRTSWVKAIPMAAAAMAVAYIVITLGMLHRELARRRDCRRKRLALPSALADGVNAGERRNARKLLESLILRVNNWKDLNPQSLMVFDCLIHDLIYVSPGIIREVQKAVTSGEHSDEKTIPRL